MYFFGIWYCKIKKNVIKYNRSFKGGKIMENVLNIEIKVTEVIKRLGSPANVKGYYFLREAIIRTIDDVAFVENITKRLYPEIAICNSTTSGRVERAIRHVIEVSWERGESESQDFYFGYNKTDGRSRPTNSEFIAAVADQIRLTMKTGTLK